MSRSVRELLRSRLGIAVIGCALGCIPARMSEGAALKVSPGGDIKSINRAVQLAQPGDRIEIAAGVYREDSILIDKRLEINGVPGAVVDGAGGGEIITITADSVVIQELELRNSEISYIVDHAAVRVDGARGCVIRRNVFRDNFFAVYLGKAVDCMISGNRIIGSRTSEAASGNGIHLWYCRGITVTGNYVSGHRDGIYFEFVEQGTVSGNISEGN
ncbi:MAG: NosD domain-containing protein, partial [Candidatus Zixiibacteriota bacterium]